MSLYRKLQDRISSDPAFAKRAGERADDLAETVARLEVGLSLIRDARDLDLIEEVLKQLLPSRRQKSLH